MALIKLGSMVTRISGKIGGQTFGTSAAGSYVKNSGTPRKSITIAQQGKMSLMGTTAQSWRELTQTQRDTFNAASPDYPYLNRVGETKFYSGYAIFGQLVNNLSLGQFAVTPIPLPKFSFTPLSDVNIDDMPDEQFFEASSGQTGITYRLFVTRSSSVGISNAYKNHFFMASGLPNMSGIVYFDWSAAYLEKWGQMPASGKFFWRVDAVQGSTGQIFKGINSGVISY